jgi:anti-anti-sigma factor
MQCTFADGDASVALAGDLKFANRTEFRVMVTRLMNAKASSAAIDVSRLEAIDSAGLGMLLIARDEAIKLHRTLVLRGPAGQVKKMFDLSKFETLFTVQP